MLGDKNASAIRKMFEEGKVLKARYGEDNVYDFSLGNPDLDPPREVIDAIKEVAADESHGAHGYMSNAGYDECRAAMALKVSKEQGCAVDASSVIMTVGAASALTSVLKTLLMPGEEVVCPAPFFAEYTHYVHNHGGVLKPVLCNEDFSLNIEGIRTAVNEKTVAVIINSPNNPTGKVYSAAEIRSLVAVLKDAGKKFGRFPYLVCDEPYRDIVYDGVKVPPVFPEYEYAVVVSSFAKNLSLPGERIGYICANPANPEKAEFIAACTMAFRMGGFVNAPAFFQKVVAKSWNASVDFSSYLKRRNLLKGVLDEAGLKYSEPQGAFYLWVKVPDSWGSDDAGFVECLEKNLILCAPGAGFGQKGYFRIAYCVSERTIVNSREAFKRAAATKPE